MHAGKVIPDLLRIVLGREPGASEQVVIVRAALAIDQYELHRA